MPEVPERAVPPAWLADDTSEGEPPSVVLLAPPDEAGVQGNLEIGGAAQDDHTAPRVAPVGPLGERSAQRGTGEHLSGGGLVEAVDEAVGDDPGSVVEVRYGVSEVVDPHIGVGDDEGVSSGAVERVGDGCGLDPWARATRTGDDLEARVIGGVAAPDPLPGGFSVVVSVSPRDYDGDCHLQ